MIDKFLNIFRIPDLRKKLIFTGLILLVYRLGGKVPIPGIDKTALAAMMQGYSNEEYALINSQYDSKNKITLIINKVNK